MAGSRVSDWRYGGGAGGGSASTTSRPSTCNSIVDMLLTKKKQAAAASHLIAKQVPQNARHRAIFEKAQEMTVKNLMARNPRLPVESVKKYVGIELGKAM